GLETERPTRRMPEDPCLAPTGGDNGSEVLDLPLRGVWLHVAAVPPATAVVFEHREMAGKQGRQCLGRVAVPERPGDEHERWAATGAVVGDAGAVSGVCGLHVLSPRVCS